MTTSEPSLAVEIAEAAKAKGVYAVDAPVSGGDIGAREARLSIMIGGDKAVVDALQPCWQAMGKTIVHQGGPGAGQHAKMVNQILISTMMIGVCEALLYGYKAGLNLETVMQSVSTGAAGDWVTAVTCRSGFGAGVPKTWNSATWPDGAPVLELNFSCTSATRADTVMSTELPVAGSQR